MTPALSDTTIGILNETTNTVHKHKTGASDFETDCGISYHVSPDHLRRTGIERALGDEHTSKCGRCFPGAGGY